VTNEPQPRPWHPTPFLAASGALHAAALAGLALAPSAWPWAVGAVAANHLAITAAGLWPKSRLLGPNWIRLPPSAARRGEIALTIDDGPDPEVTPAVLALLARNRAPATFFCIGERAARHPELVAAIVAAGHAVENHSQHHRHSFSLLGPGGFAREVAAGQATLTRLAGSAPCFFRAPAGLRNPFLEPVLARQGLILASWTRRGFDTRERNPTRVARRLLGGLAAGDILLLHDGHAARGPGGRAVILEVLPRVLEAIAAAGLRPVTLRSALA
jgi:peptidoglycan/xylan/chitin deacetylase (PgdA/CDA1 family)